MKITDEKIAKYAKLVHRNCPGEVLEEIANDLDMNRFYDLFKHINKIHEIEGSLSPDVYALRNRLRDEFSNYLVQCLTTEEYKIISRYI